MENEYNCLVHRNEQANKMMPYSFIKANQQKESCVNQLLLVWQMKRKEMEDSSLYLWMAGCV